MKKSRNLLILFLAMIVLLSIFLFLKYRPQENPENIKSESANEKITLVNLDKDTINKIALKSSNSTLLFEKKDQLWTVNFTFPLIQDEVNNLSDVLMSLRAEELIAESPTDLKQYGLKNPVVTIEVSVVDDINPMIMYLGDLTPSGNSYYFKLASNPKVYTIADYNATKFILTPSAFRDNSLAQIDIHTINYFKLSRTGKPDLEIKLNTATSKLTEYGIGIWQMTKPYQKPMSVISDKFQPIIELITSITNAEQYIDDNPSDLSRYGLTKPQAEVFIKDKKSRFHLLIGKPMNDDSFYCKTSGSNSVFTIKSANLSFMGTKPFDLIEKFAFIINIDDVDRISISGLGSNHTLAIVRKTNNSSKEDSREFKTTYQIDGNKVEEQLFKTIYQSLISLVVESEYNVQPKNKTPELSMTFDLNKGSRLKTDINYVPYDYDFYSVFRDGNTEFLISKDQVKTMLRELKSLLNTK